MKIKFLFAALLLVATLRLPAATNDLTTRLQQGLFDEEANRDLNAAIADYQGLAAQFDQDRQVAATAIYRLGECYRKLGQTNDAVAQYQRLIREFADQKDLVTLSQQNLTGLGTDSRPNFAQRLQAIIARAPAGANAEPARQTQMQLLTEEIQVVAQQLASAQAQVQIGKLPADGTLPFQQKLLELKRQLAALEAGQTMQPLADSAPTTDEESQEIIRIQQMIQNSPDLINTPNGVLGNRHTPLSRAAVNGWLKVATYLLDHGADVNAGASTGTTALSAAAGAGNRAMVALLLSRGAEVNPPNPQVQGALAVAVSRGFPSVVETLIAGHADVNTPDNGGTTPLHEAVANGQDKIAQMLLAAGANPNVKNHDGLTPLMQAPANASADTLKALLAAGADPNATTDKGRTALSYAAERGSLPALQALLAAKANPNGANLNAPLLFAINHGDLPAAECLLKAGANPNYNGAVDGSLRKPGWNGESFANFHQTATPMFFAVWMDQLPMVQLLLKYHADPNDVQTDGRSLLFSALPKPEILVALLAAGARVDARDVTSAGYNFNTITRRPNWTPLLQAMQDNRPPAVVEALLDHGANPNLPDDAFARTPLLWSIGWDAYRVPNRAVVVLLLAHHADPNLPDLNGRTLLDYLKIASHNTSPANQTELASIADLLRQHGALDHLPDWNHLAVIRPDAGFSRVYFTRETNDWNQFTLLELLAVQCRFLALAPASTGGNNDKSSFFQARNQTLPFPDLARLRIHRPSPDQKSTQEIPANLAAVLQTGDCSHDVPLTWGDVVEIPETDHPLNETWPGFSDLELRNLIKCLTRQVSIIVKGQTNIVTLALKIRFKGENPPMPGYLPVFNTEISSEVPFWLGPVLLQSQLVLTSSDLSRVQVTRHDAKSGKTRVWGVDCTGISQNHFNDPDLWLRDGDIVEIPEKP